MLEARNALHRGDQGHGCEELICLGETEVKGGAAMELELVFYPLRILDGAFDDGDIGGGRYGGRYLSGQK